MIAIAFGAAAALGAVLRWGVGRQLHGAQGTLLVNIVGSGVLGLLYESNSDTRLIFGVAGLGALTTFSTFAVEALEASPKRAASYVAATLAGGVAAAWVGIQLA